MTLDGLDLLLEGILIHKPMLSVMVNIDVVLWSILMLFCFTSNERHEEAMRHGTWNVRGTGIGREKLYLILEIQLSKERERKKTFRVRLS